MEINLLENHENYIYELKKHHHDIIDYFNDTTHSFNLNASLEPFLIKKSKINKRSF